MKTKALFFSRGRGHGHAIPDMAIVEEMYTLAQDIEVTFVSYATGAQTFKAANHHVYDLGLPANNRYLATLSKARELIKRLKPDIVIAHEEYAALVAAYEFEIPSIFISAWLPLANTIGAESIAYASSIIIIEEPGVFAVPKDVTTKPIYVGRILRKLSYGLVDRARLRAEMRIAEDAVVIVVVPGGAATEEDSPIADIVLSAFLKIPQEGKYLYWLAAKDFEMLQKRTAGIRGIEIMEFVYPVERMLACADAIITKGTRGITLDAASLGIPSISLSPGINPIDDTLVPRIKSNIALNSMAVDGEILFYFLEKIIKKSAIEKISDLDLSERGLPLAAKTLRSEIYRLNSRVTGITAIEAVGVPDDD
ncbi:MAG TPA: hypothetical protein VK717_01685 [Opitutaceae bacterium]|jgi:UDP-N-acetylglucosamine:LPS N-acetylglucosamine transferase|nr:hypothetical protein [Opitutaceae bacterium]